MPREFSFISSAVERASLKETINIPPDGSHQLLSCDYIFRARRPFFCAITKPTFRPRDNGPFFLNFFFQMSVMLMMMMRSCFNRFARCVRLWPGCRRTEPISDCQRCSAIDHVIARERSVSARSLVATAIQGPCSSWRRAFEYQRFGGACRLHLQLQPQILRIPQSPSSPP